MVDFHREHNRTVLLPRVNGAMQSHFVARITANPRLITMLSVDENRRTRFLSLVDILKVSDLVQILAAFELCCIQFAKLHLRNIIRDNHIAIKLWSDICLLGRLPKIVVAFDIALEYLPFLRSVNIVCIGTPNVPLIWSSQSQSLKKNLRRCGLSPDVTTVHNNINPNSTIDRCQALHDDFQRLDPVVHADTSNYLLTPEEL